MSDLPRSWIDRVLAYEELDPAARAQVDVQLERSPQLRTLHEALREREARAHLRGALPPESGWAALASGDDDDVAEAESLRALLAQAAGSPVGPPPALQVVPGRAAAPWVRWLLPVAAAAAGLLLLWPRPVTVPAPPSQPVHAPAAPAAGPVLSRLAILPAGTTRAGAADEWRSGDAFVLRFHLSRRAVPVVFLLDAQGAVARLNPPPGSPGTAHPEGDMQLPAPSSGLRWSFDGPPGAETFFVTSVPEGGVADTLEARLTRSLAGVASRSARGDTLEAALRGIAGEVRRLEVVHR